MRVAPLVLLALFGLAPAASAQGLFGASPNQPPRDDKTGTNPLNLQQQVDVSNTYFKLDTFYLDTATYRHAFPVFNRRVRVAGLVPFGYSNLTGRSEGGLGDLGADVEWTPWLSSRGGLVAGLRTPWNTATTDGLGLGGANTLMPYAQYVAQLSPTLLVAPFVGQRVSAGGDEFATPYNDTLLGATVVWRVTPRVWVSSTPQWLVDHEGDRAYGDVGGEVGVLVRRQFSAYVRPSIGVGRQNDKPYDWGLAAGLRIVP